MLLDVGPLRIGKSLGRSEGGGVWMWMALGRKDSLSLPPRDNPLSLTVLLQLVVVSWEGPNTLIDHYPRLTSTLLGQGEEDAVGRSGSSLVNCIADKYECLRMISPRKSLTQLRQSLKVTRAETKTMQCFYLILQNIE